MLFIGWYWIGGDVVVVVMMFVCQVVGSGTGGYGRDCYTVGSTDISSSYVFCCKGGMVIVVLERCVLPVQ